MGSKDFAYTVLEGIFLWIVEFMPDYKSMMNFEAAAQTNSSNSTGTGTGRGTVVWGMEGGGTRKNRKIGDLENVK